MAVVKIGRAVVDCDPTATRKAYEAVRGGIDSCECPYCSNYRLVRKEVYPKAFRDLLESLGIDYRKETELTHLPSDDDDASYGHSCFGHFAFVGKVIGEEPAGPSDSDFNFGFRVGSGRVHPTTLATFGDSLTMMDLDFSISRVPKAAKR